MQLVKTRGTISNGAGKRTVRVIYQIIIPLGSGTRIPPIRLRDNFSCKLHGGKKIEKKFSPTLPVPCSAAITQARQFVHNSFRVITGLLSPIMRAVTSRRD